MQIFVKTLTGKTSDEFRILIVCFNTSFLYIFMYKIYYCMWKGIERIVNGGKFLQTHHMRIGTKTRPRGVGLRHVRNSTKHENTPRRCVFILGVFSVCGTASSSKTHPRKGFCARRVRNSAEHQSFPPWMCFHPRRIQLGWFSRPTCVEWRRARKPPPHVCGRALRTKIHPRWVVFALAV